MPTNNADDFNNPIAISQGGTNASSMATVDGVVYFDGTRLVTTGAGMAGQLLTSQGSGNPPVWAAGGGGAPSGQGWDLIQTQLFNGTKLTFTTGITNAYNTYVVVYSGGGVYELDVRYSTNGGSSYAVSGYTSTASRITLLGGAGSIPPGSSPASSNLWSIINTGVGGPFEGAYGSTIYLFNVTNGLTTTALGLGSNNRIWNMCYSSFGNSAAINALQFSVNDNPVNAPASLSLYGVNE